MELSFGTATKSGRFTQSGPHDALLVAALQRSGPELRLPRHTTRPVATQQAHQALHSAAQPAVYCCTAGYGPEQALGTLLRKLHRAILAANGECKPHALDRCSYCCLNAATVGLHNVHWVQSLYGVHAAVAPAEHGTTWCIWRVTGEPSVLCKNSIWPSAAVRVTASGCSGHPMGFHVVELSPGHGRTSTEEATSACFKTRWQSSPSGKGDTGPAIERHNSEPLAHVPRLTTTALYRSNRRY